MTTSTPQPQCPHDSICAARQCRRGARRAALMIAFGVGVWCAGARAARAQDTGTQARFATADRQYRNRVLGIYDEDTGMPVEGVEVRDVLSGLSALTTATGTISLVFLPDGGSLVQLRKLGYASRILRIAIAPSDTTPITLVLTRVVTLAKVTVTDSTRRYLSPVLQEAEERMRSHEGGYFIGESEMRKRDDSNMSTTILAHFPGLFIAAGPHGEAWLLSSRTTCVHAFQCLRPNCYISVYLDGIKVYDPVNAPGTGLPDFNRLSPRDYEIAEFYPGGASIPVGFGGGNNVCGALLLWSRER